MSSNLYGASAQWATRPPDERFWTVFEALESEGYRRSAETEMDWGNASVAQNDRSLGILRYPEYQFLPFNSWSFGQLCSRLGAPAAFFRDRLSGRPDVVVNALTALRPSGSFVAYSVDGAVRALTSERYSRIYNYDILSQISYYAKGWGAPPARPVPGETRTRIATANDVRFRGTDVGLSIKEGDLIGPAGIYLSDEDMYLFLVNPEPIGAPDGETLYRGVIVSNSEVGKASFRIESFFFRGVCGNHIIWDVRERQSLRVRHVGRANKRMYSDIRSSFNESPVIDVTPVAKAMYHTVGTKIDDIMNEVSKVSDLSKAIVTKALDAAVPALDGPKGSLWGIINGLTRVSQEEVNADRRHALDREAGKLFALVA